MCYKATISNEIVAIIVALGCIFENTHATPILLTITSILTSLPKFNVTFNDFVTLVALMQS